MKLYSNEYLKKSMELFASMLDYGVHDLGFELTEFLNMFFKTEIYMRFKTGDCSMLFQYSGVELVYETLHQNKQGLKSLSCQNDKGDDSIYWLGLVLTYYQWLTSVPMDELLNNISTKEILDIYYTEKEVDPDTVVDKMTAMLSIRKEATNLQLQRKKKGLTQAKLSELSGIPIRTIQQYEQRQKDINRAQIRSVFSLANVLGCSAETILEPECAKN